MTSAAYRVDGMTCGHCVAAVSREIGKLAGVTDVRVDLDSGTVSVSSIDDLAAEQVRAAVEDAGYRLVD